MRIVARLLVLLPLLWVEGVWAVDCPDLNYDLNTQAEVDALGATQCDHILGYLRIRETEDVRNLDSLSSLTHIDSGLFIQFNTNLMHLDGLSGLTIIGGLDLIANPLVGNLDGLSNLTSASYLRLRGTSLTDIDGLSNVVVTGSIEIEENSSLTHLDGLSKISSLSSRLRIQYNAALTNIDGLSNIVSAGDTWIMNNPLITNLDGLSQLASVAFLTIEGNESLTDLAGLSRLSIVDGDFVVNQQSAITDFSGLSNLTEITGSLGIGEMNSLVSLDGLSGLTVLGGGLLIGFNEVLESLDGLQNIGSPIDYVETVRNPALADCGSLAGLLGWPNGPPSDAVAGVIEIGSNDTGCNTISEILASVSGPTKPVINQATTSSNSISLGFTPSTTTDTLFPITGYSASCTGSQTDVSGSPATDLLDNTPIRETLTISGYDPTSVLSSIEVDIDITHSDPTDLYITLTTPEGTELVLWNQGSSGGEDLVGTFPTTLTPVDSLDSVARQTMDGDWVVSIEDIDVGPLVREGVLNSWGIRITEELARNGSGSPIEVFGATRGRDYTCTVAPVTKLGTTPVSDPYTVSVPLELPSVPTITSTDYEDGKITLTVSVSDNGGTDITGYEATCTDGTNTVTGTSTSSPITVSGLTNDVAYTCTVTATNSVGTSSASAATAPITPEETATGLPIWLLYQATQ